MTAPPGTRRRSFGYDYRAPVERVWAAMADTARYNEAAALPRYEVREELLPDNGIRFHAQARIGPVALAWEDLPCNWVRNRWFEHTRRFTCGPLGHLTAELRLTPTAEGCHGEYAVEASPRNPMGRLLLATGFFRSVERTFTSLSRAAERHAHGGQGIVFPVPPPRLDEAARAQLAQQRQRLGALPQSHGLADRLVELVATAPENELMHIRPLVLARRWGVAEAATVELCLEATRLGLLELRWDILCPRCRAAKTIVRGLDELPEGAHCSTCNIDYGRDFSRNVELSFRPSPQLRAIGTGEFCLLGPMSTPHILLHVTLAPREVRELDFEAGPGSYRLRTLEAGPETDIAHQGDRFPALVIEPDRVAAGEPAPAGRIRLENRTPWERTAVVEDRAWTADALTADRVTAMQSFRDLFSDQVLRPGDEVGIGRIALLFSDLEGSTALYGEVGDARAYSLVRDHFAFMQAVIRRHQGAIVKTIGDAVMAAFVQPAEAVAAAVEMQRELTRRTAGGPSIRLKIGLHIGPCIAVNLNDRLDYFGTTVNMAARLQALSRGDDIVVSTELAADTEVADQLSGFAPTIERAELKGFAEPVPYLRLRFERGPRAPAA